MHLQLETIISLTTMFVGWLSGNFTVFNLIFLEVYFNKLFNLKYFALFLVSAANIISKL